MPHQDYECKEHFFAFRKPIQFRRATDYYRFAFSKICFAQSCKSLMLLKRTYIVDIGRVQDTHTENT